MNKSQPNYDVVVVGGGMVGAAAALGLAQIGWSVALLEHDAPAPFDKDSVPDLRVSALGCTSVALLKQLGAWPQVQQMRYAPYRRLETWNNRGHRWCLMRPRCLYLSWALWSRTGFCSLLYGNSLLNALI